MQEKVRTILYIDDEVLLRELIQETLTKVGYKVAVAEDGDVGLTELEKNYYDLVLLDIIMPKLLGTDVLKRIKTSGLRQGKIVMFSNLTDENIIREAFELGADGYEITASVTPDILVQRVNGYLSGSITPEESKKRALELVEEEERNEKVYQEQQKKQAVDDNITDFLKIELTRDFTQNHKDASEYDGFIEGQAINYLLGDDIEAPIKAIKNDEIRTKVNTHRADIVKRVHKILASDPDYRKLIVYYLRRKCSYMRANFPDDKSFFASPQWQRVAQVITPYDKEFEEKWSWEEYKRMLAIYAKKRGHEELIVQPKSTNKYSNLVDTTTPGLISQFVGFNNLAKSKRPK